MTSEQNITATDAGVIESGENRRQAERRYFRSTVILHPGSQGLGNLSTGHLLNVSTSGAAIMTRGTYSVGERLYLAIQNPRRETVREIQGEIRWVQHVAHDVHQFGLAFREPLTLGEISRIP
ncbi:MAG: PilZ domain-containing protein [Planctomycetota bacterium]